MSTGATGTLRPGLRDWLHAFRLRTLPLAAGSIVAGSGLAAFDGAFRPWIFGLALLTAILLQILSNLANDLGDHVNGADNAGRVGPQRSVQSGRISAAAMKRAMLVCGLLAFASGVALLLVGTGLGPVTGLFLLLGLAAIAAAVKYTYGASPYGYAGLGDLSVLIFFGLAGVAGTYFLHAGGFRPALLLPAGAFGLWSTAVLNTNNMRDVRGDAASGKRTLAVRLGSERAKSYHGLLVLGGLGCLVLFTAVEFRGMPQWGFLVTTPLLATHLRQVLNNREPAALDPELKRLSLGTFFTAIAFAAGLILA
ncbi:MAG: 1,4-dihydroxy-2-naphthoate polyprenyltransferase [Flavobacteriales bacterium]|nr:1,4-dihydroxy-2-naphthoate polyprenyltransferase [Flavobacteriales bacterium]MCB0817632.1 1,4-dihydroxy-2-naphthoate polyprenyltransferase [Flavobacteriales bacterium]MCB9179980.1 1,4-dihydroxy-2-naphthoate polyprenyltransferase [Flavobacteriales bacterium]MCB9199714.1 1,4-dihydroxy-2-naphthoate polyprenyltransferase [Flavobacteriales bacterium]HOP42044.1 1,4-dihydroxy-2-naphthoate polyprenyltransferase [Flavobacteriales bacterium]